jgi:tetratricopeptide (TPR) repeat protein
VALAILVLPKVFGAGLDRSLYLVASFEHRGTSAPGLLDGDKCELLLHSAFTRWEGVTVIGQPLANDSRARDGFQPATLERALAQAKALRSGWLVWGQVWQFEDSNVVRAGLYDVARGRAEREFTIRVALDLSDADAKFAQLADSLLLGVAGPPVSRAGAMGTRSLPAWQAYAEGQAALARWHLDSASGAFTRALLADPQYPQAALWLAQIDQWTGRPVEKWRRTATLAAGAGDRLAVQDRLMATGLVALADQQYQAACTAYQQMVSRDSMDYVGWYGLGECRIADSLVVRDAKSPSGLAFRSSYGAAANAYAHALRLVPSTHIAFGDTAFDRLSRLLGTERNVFRPGRGLEGDSIRYAAFPSLVHDTLAFIPYPLDEALGDPRRFPESNAAAVRRNQHMLRDVTNAWLDAFPASPTVLETHALVLETSGAVEPGGTPKRSALDAVRQARRFTRDPVQALRLAVTEARLLLKLGDYRGTRAIADSVLAAAPDPPPALAALLVGPALLVGHVHRAAALAPIGFGDSLMDFTARERSAVMVPAWSLLTYASMGGPRDSILTLSRRVNAAIDNYVAPEQREQVRSATLDGPAVEAFSEIGITERHRPGVNRLHLLRIQLDLARGNVAATRAALDSLWALHRSWKTSLTVDGTYLDAALYASAGDTAAALQVLDAALLAPLNLDTYTLTWITLPANLVRAMILRARLAAAAGDRAAAAQWAAAVVALWSNADAAFQPVVDSMRALAAAARPPK